MSESTTKKAKTEPSCVRITTGGKIANYCTHVLKQLGAAEDGDEVLSPQVELHGTDKALPKAISVAELVKRSSKRRLRQTTTLSDDKGKAKISIVLAVETK